MSLAIAAVLLTGCGSIGLPSNNEPIAASTVPVSQTSETWTPATISASGAILPEGDKSLSPQAELFPGTGKLLNLPQDQTQPDKASSGNPVTLNLVDVSVPQAAKAILGDILGVNYFVDDAVKATVTIQTPSPVSPSVVLDMFQTTLRAKGATIVPDKGFYRIVPADQGQVSSATFQPPSGLRDDVGVKIKTVSLRYVSATEMSHILQPIVAKSTVLRADTGRNLLVVQGTQKELAAIDEAVNIFDVDIMKGMSFALIPVAGSDLEGMARELDTVFASGRERTGKGIVQFIPNSRLNAILVISPRAEYLERAETWVKRLDHAATGAERQLYVYHIQNRPAAELAKVLQGIFAGQAETSIAPKGTVAPKFVEAQVGGAVTAANGQASAATGDAVAQPASVELAAGTTQDASNAAPPDGQRDTSSDKRIKIVADESNNALLIMAVAKDYDHVLKVLQHIDAVPTQVLLEATIAEVSLNDDMQFGVRWYFQSHAKQFTFSNDPLGAVASAFPGFSYFFSLPNIQIALNALAQVTKVNVISSPTLMVLDNKTAVLQVGDQVPITTQTSVSNVAGGAPTVNSVELKDTGIILKVTPRVNDSGRVVLEIEQEVSDVVKTTTSNIDSPTIQQRKIKTTVSVEDGAALALGGLIQEKNTTTKDQVPVAGDIPLFGNLFKSKDNTIVRTELLIIIRPHVVRDDNEAHEVTEEFKKHMHITMKQHNNAGPDIRENIDRALQ